MDAVVSRLELLGGSVVSIGSVRRMVAMPTLSVAARLVAEGSFPLHGQVVKLDLASLHLYSASVF